MTKAVLISVVMLAFGCERRPRSPAEAQAIVLDRPVERSKAITLPEGTRTALPDEYWNLAGYWKYDCETAGKRIGSRIARWPCAAFQIELADTWAGREYLQVDDAIGPSTWGVEATGLDQHLDPLVPPYDLELVQPSIGKDGRLVAGTTKLGDGPTQVDMARWRRHEVTVLPAAAIRAVHESAGLQFDDVLAAQIREVIDGPDQRVWLVTLRLRRDGRAAHYEVDTRTGATRSLP